LAISVAFLKFDLKGALLIGKTRNAFLGFWANYAVTATAGELDQARLLLKRSYIVLMENVC